jgi:hypothetical protein
MYACNLLLLLLLPGVSFPSSPIGSGLTLNSVFLLDFLNVIITTTVWLAPTSTVNPPRDSAYDTTLAESRAEPSAGPYRLSGVEGAPLLIVLPPELVFLTVFGL